VRKHLGSLNFRCLAQLLHPTPDNTAVK
jgi:hypothetical protein